MEIYMREPSVRIDIQPLKQRLAQFARKHKISVRAACVAAGDPNFPKDSKCQNQVFNRRADKLLNFIAAVNAGQVIPPREKKAFRAPKSMGIYAKISDIELLQRQNAVETARTAYVRQCLADEQEQKCARTLIPSRVKRTITPRIGETCAATAADFIAWRQKRIGESL
jgi:hypothetical protein